MKTSAGWLLNQRKPIPAPIKAPQNTVSSPAPRTFRMNRYSESRALPVT